MAHIATTLREGKLHVRIASGGTELTLTEAEWYDAQRGVEQFMKPVWDQRNADRKAAEAAELDAEMARWQRTETISGHEFRIQQHPASSAHHDTCAWLAAYCRDDAPFLVQVDDAGSRRPWKIEMRHEKNYWGKMVRPDLRNDKGGLIRFATIAGAVRKALDLEMHKDPLREPGPVPQEREKSTGKK